MGELTLMVPFEYDDVDPHTGEHRGRPLAYRPASPSEVVAAARQLVDYEAALNEYLRLVWAHDGLGPYAEELADKVLPNGVAVPRISNFEEAKRIVNAALGIEGEETS